MYKIKLEFVNELLAYLGTRPYNDVVNLIQGFGNKEKFEAIEEEVKKK